MTTRIKNSSVLSFEPKIASISVPVKDTLTTKGALSYLPLAQLSDDAFHAALERPYVQKQEGKSTAIIPSPEEVRHALSAISNANNVFNFGPDDTVATTDQATFVALAAGLDAADALNFDKLESSLEDIKIIGQIQDEDFNDQRSLLYQKSYDACVNLAIRSIPLGDWDLFMLLRDKAQMCAMLAPEIATCDDEFWEDMQETVYSNKCNNFMLESIHYASRGKTHRARECLKKEISIKDKATDLSMIGIEIDPIHILKLGTSSSISKILEDPEQIYENSDIFSKKILRRSAEIYLQPVADRAKNIHNLFISSIKKLAKASKRSHKIILIDTIDLLKRSESINQKVVHDIRALHRPIEENLPYTSDNNLRIFIRENTTDPILYRKKSVNRKIKNLEIKEGISPKKGSTNEDFDNSETDILHLSNYHIRKINNSIMYLLQIGINDQDTYNIIYSLLNIDLSEYEHRKEQSIIKGSPLPYLKLKAIKTPLLLQYQDSIVHLEEYTRTLFQTPIETTIYSEPKKHINKGTQFKQARTLYQYFYDYQKRFINQTLQKIEHTPYSLNFEKNDQNAQSLRTLAITILQNSIMHEYRNINTMFQMRNSDSSKNTLLITTIVDILANISQLERHLERACQNFPPECIEHIHPKTLQEMLSTLTDEKVMQIKNKRLKSWFKPSVRFDDDINKITEFNQDDFMQNRSEYVKHSLSTVRGYACLGDIKNLLDEINLIRSQCDDLGINFPQHEINKEMFRCYNVSMEKILGLSIKYAKLGDVGMMLQHLRKIPYYSILAHRKSPNIFPILKIGYAESIRNSLSILATDPHHMPNSRELRHRKNVLIQAEQHAQMFTKVQIASELFS